MKRKFIRVAAISDMHIGKYQFSSMTFNSVEQDADILLVPGDLTHRGLIEQAKKCPGLFKNITIPIVAVLGNHDYDNDKETEIAQLLEEGKMKVLDGDVAIFAQAGL